MSTSKGFEESNLRKRDKIKIFRSSEWEEFCRYLLVGGVAFVVDFSVLWFGASFLRLHYLVSAAFGFLFGVVVNYALSIKWAFAYRRMKNRKMLEFATFAWIGVVGIFWNEVFMFLFTWMFRGKYLLAKVPTTVLVFLWNFAVRKILLFRR